MPLPKTLADDCFLHDKDRLKHREAIEILRERVAAVVRRQHGAVVHGER